MFLHIPESLSMILLAAMLIRATWTDVKFHRISNSVTFSGVALGLMLRVWGLGLEGLLDGLGGAGLGLLLLLPFYALGGMAAGDVKLMSAVGAFLGASNVLPAIAMTLIAGGMLGVLVLLIRSGIVPICRRYALILKCLWITGKWSWIPPAPGEAAATSFPYALAIFLGTASALWWLGRFSWPPVI